MEISALKEKAKASLATNWGTAILVNIVVILISAVVCLMTCGLGILIIPVFSFGLASYFQFLVRSGYAPFGTVFSDTFSNFLKKWCASLLQYLYISLWSLLFFIPGIVKSYSYAMTTFILLDNPGMGPNEAITKIREMMHGYKWKLFCLDLSFFPLHLLACFTLGLPYLYVIPMMNASRAAFYEELKQIKGTY